MTGISRCRSFVLLCWTMGPALRSRLSTLERMISSPTFGHFTGKGRPQVHVATSNKEFRKCEIVFL